MKLGTIKLNICIIAIIFLIAAILIYPQNKFKAGDITFSFKNIDSTSTQLSGGNEIAKLYNSDYTHLLSTLLTNNSGVATFSSELYGSYNIEGWHEPVPATIFGVEFWGVKVVNHRSSNTQVSFTRNMPYSLMTKVYIDSTNKEVTGGNVTAGTKLRIEQSIINPNTKNLYVKGRIILDRDKSGNYDFDKTSQGTMVNSNNTIKRKIYYIPAYTGDYYYASGTLTNVKGKFVITDGTYWFNNPLFKVIGNESLVDTIEFSGITWNVRSGFGNPDSNNWSNSIKTVWVDENGELHLKIRNINGRWYCSEIEAPKSYGYGEYRLYLASNVENYDPNIVVGFFIYQTDSQELDIEFSRWGNPNGFDGWYTVQPSPYNNTTQDSFKINQNGDYSTHILDWNNDSTFFQSYYGNYSSLPSKDSLINQWTYNGKNGPIPGSEKLIINFYLDKINFPISLKDVELIVKAVYIPGIISNVTAK